MTANFSSMNQTMARFMILFFVLIFLASSAMAAAAVSGELRKWHRVSLTFDGPSTSEDANPNPFTDYRLNVTFTSPSGRSIIVPGFYAADGDAANTGTTAGSKWRVHLTPSETGNWSYVASFRQGSNVAISMDPNAGTSTSFDGETGSFAIDATNKTGVDFRGKGLLQYANGYYLKFAETGENYLKGGADSPENFLAFKDFDGTFDTGGLSAPGLQNGLHAYGPHVAHWSAGDPVWKGDKGKGIIGAVNYLSSKGGNSIYFLTYNLDGGDGADTWPWTSNNERSRFDVSKLDQWEIVFSQMDKKGIMLHVVTQETENDRRLGGNGSLNDIRKLYYRELVARFGHHLAIMWNLGEENNNNDSERKQFAQFIRDLDPYDHPITVHTHNDAAQTYNGLYGSSVFEASSLQGSIYNYNSWAKEIRQKSAAAGRKWSVFADESYSGTQDVKPNLSNLDELRKVALWGNLMGGGSGVEWYFGYQNTFGDVQSEDWSMVGPLWDHTRYALSFFKNLPLNEMEPNDGVVSNASNAKALVKAGSVYVIYLKDGGSPSVQLPTGSYTVTWYQPTTGQFGTPTTVNGNGSAVSIGSPSFQGDAAALIINTNTPITTSGNGDFLESNGLVVIETEAVSPVGDWRLQTSEAGFTGTGYYNWTGADHFTEGDTGHGVLRYPIKITRAGDYTLILRSNKCCGPVDQYNDLWVSVNGSTPMKMFKEGTSEGFDWAKRLEPSPGVFRDTATFTLAAGTNILSLSARSSNFKIDRIHLYNTAVFTGNPFDATLPVSSRDGGSTGGGGGGTTTTPNPTNPGPGPLEPVDPGHCWDIQSFNASAHVSPVKPYPYISYSDSYQAGQTAFFIEDNSGLNVTDISRYSALCRNGAQGTYAPYTIAYMESIADEDWEPTSGQPAPTSSSISEINLGNNNPVQDSSLFCDGSHLWFGGEHFTTLPIPFGYATKAVNLRFSQNNINWTPLADSFAVNVLRNDSFFKSKDLLIQNDGAPVESVLKIRTNQKLRVFMPVQNTGTTNWLADGGTPNNAVYYLTIFNPAFAENRSPEPFIINPLTYTTTANASHIPIYFAEYQTRDDATLGHPVYNSVIAQGQEALFQFDLTAPSQPGVYQLAMQMTQQGFQNFGEAITTTIEVVPAVNDATCQVDVLGQGDEAGKRISNGTLSELNPSKKYTIQIDFKNTGNQSWKLNQTEGVGVEFVSLSGVLSEQFVNLPASISITADELPDPNQTGMVQFIDLAVQPGASSVADLSFQANSAFFEGKFGENCRLSVPIAKSYNAQGIIEIIRVRDGHVMAANENLVVDEEYEFFVHVTNTGSVWAATNSTDQTGLWNGTTAFEGYISLRDGNGDYTSPLQEYYQPSESSRHALTNPSVAVATGETRKSQAITRIPKKAGSFTEAFRMIEDHLAPDQPNPTRYGEFGSTITRSITIEPAPIIPSCTIDQSEILQGVRQLYSVRYYNIPAPASITPQCPTGATLDPETVQCGIHPTNPNAGLCTYECTEHAQLGIFPLNAQVNGGGKTASCVKDISVVVDLSAPPIIPPVVP